MNLCPLLSILLLSALIFVISFLLFMEMKWGLIYCCFLDIVRWILKLLVYSSSLFTCVFRTIDFTLSMA